MNSTDDKFIKLGHSDLLISKLGLGCMGMSEFYGAANDAESIKTIHRAYELGVNHFDTADIYGFGHNEILLGKALKGLERDRIVVATKCGFQRKKDDPNFLAVSNDPEYIKKCCDDSLRRLGVDYIDLFYLHRVSSDTPIEVSMETLSNLVKAGKIRNIGLSEVDIDTIFQANNIHPLAAIQNEYSLWSRSITIEEEILALCKILKIAFIAFSPLGCGFLGGKIDNVDALSADDVRRGFPRFHKDSFSHNLQIISSLKKIAMAKNATVAQIALAWVFVLGKNVTAIPGTKRISYLEENMAALDIVLSQDEIKELMTSIPRGFALGARAPAKFAQFAEY